MLVVANTVRASFVRGSEATSDSQFSIRLVDNAPEDDNGATSLAEMESEFIEVRIFSSRTSWDGWGAAGSLEDEAPMVCETVCGGGRDGVRVEGKLSPPDLSRGRAPVQVAPGGTFWEIHVMRDRRARGGQSTGSHLEPQAFKRTASPSIVGNWSSFLDSDATAHRIPPALKFAGHFGIGYRDFD